MTMVSLASLMAACGGGGGGAAGAPPAPPPAPPVIVAPAPAITPIAVQSTSYANAKGVGMQITLPNAAAANFLNRTENIQNGYALADFFQDGTYSLVTFTQNYTPDGKTAGSVYFFKKVGANWVNSTAAVLKDQTGCITPRKVIVADFNGDKKPDVFAACHGIDRELAAGEKAGEYSRLLLSQPDGTYKNTGTAATGYFHGASAADINADGYPDIAVTDNIGHSQPYFLMNNRDGTFTPDYNRMPISSEANRTQCAVACPLQIYSVELIDFNGDGKVDLWLGGADDKSIVGFAPAIFTNPGAGDFRNAPRTVLPSVIGYPLNNPLDIVFVNETIYLSLVGPLYTNYGVQQIDYKTLSSKVVYSNTGKFSNGSVWVDWLIPLNKNIVAASAAYSVSIGEAPAPAIAVRPTSYENAKSMGFAAVTLPQAEVWAAAYARADFKGDGSITLFSSHRTYDNKKPLAEATAGVMGFYTQKNGAWVAEPGMIDSAVSCIEARKAVVADFNGDKKPDVLLACTGYDAGTFPGERMMLIASTPSGVFHVTRIGDAGFYHGVAAADLDKDGIVDYVATDNKRDAPLRMFKGKGDGTFSEVANAFPSSTNFGGYFTLELLDINGDGHIDLLAGGHEFEGTRTIVVYGSGSPVFTAGEVKPLPATEATAGVVLDFVKVGDKLFVGRTNGGASGFYTKLGLQTIDLKTLSTIDLKVRDADLFVWLLPMADGVISDRTDRPL